ncbi:response regulator transcription factor [Rugamonas sp. CCM 8940]|uniref:helix-turn-helix transcriptional regulator n=1 Tax=Rugamonas sp. CCM 8940 TaxID=2765359 RepID=UPI0018F58696|nr:LuxR C-terminal-related transcriptional regulator [Rugamonas sp. CCM 8940]MBJ7312886.1 response regulator transcription factor [Rugamonas sp. CCM 8940]
MLDMFVNDHLATVAELVSLIRDTFPSIEMSTAVSIQDAAKLIKETDTYTPNIMLLDTRLSSSDGAVQHVAELRAQCPQHAISAIFVPLLSDGISISLYRSRQRLRAIGHNGYHSVLQIIASLSDVREPAVAAAAAQDPPLPGLTNRQKELIALLLEGQSNKAIARTLDLSYGTVKNYIFDLMRLLGVKSRLELVTKVRGTAAVHQPPHVRQGMCASCGVPHGLP